MDSFGRWTDDPVGDLQRTWCWQDHPADQYLPARPLSDGEIAEWIEEIRSYGDNRTADAIESDPPEWTGERWSVRTDGIPGILLDEGDETLSDPELLRRADAGFTVGARVLAYLVIYRGEYLGAEQEAEISCGDASLFRPQEIVRVIEVGR